MIELLFGVLLQGLKLQNTKESRKYLDDIIKLRKEWHDEYSKGPKYRSNADLDHYQSILCLIAKSFVDSSGK